MALCRRRACHCGCCLAGATALWCAGAILTIVLQDDYEAQLDDCIRNNLMQMNTPGVASAVNTECTGTTELFAAAWAGRRPPDSALAAHAESAAVGWKASMSPLFAAASSRLGADNALALLLSAGA